jgi:hypothetical protein
MIVFMPISSAAISSALLALSRAPDAPDDGQSVFPVFKAVGGSLWMQVETEYEIEVHQNAVLNGISDILQPYIEREELPADTNEQLALLVESLRGQSLVVYNAFPQLFKDASKERKDMIAAGLLAEPTTP